MEKIPVVLGAHGPLGLTPREDERVLYFLPRLNNRMLQGVDPYADDLTNEQKLMIAEECRTNFRYFMYTARQREERTINGVDYVFYNPPAFLQQVGHQTYKEATGGLSIGYVPDPRDFVHSMPYLSPIYLKLDPKRHIPPMICTRGGTLVVAGAAVWSLGAGSPSDKKYADRLIPSKGHIQQALAKAQGRFWTQPCQQDQESALADMATDLVCRSISLTVQETDNTSVTDWVKKNIHLTGLKP